MAAKTSKANKPTGEQSAPSLSGESLITLDKAAKLIETTTGVPTKMETVRTWARRGVGGVKLQALTLAARTYTSREAVERFLAKKFRPSNI